MVGYAGSPVCNVNADMTHPHDSFNLVITAFSSAVGAWFRINEV